MPTPSSGVVVSESPAASEAGTEVLRQGGNAVDAAVSAAFTLAVTSPWGGNLAGGTLAVIRREDGRLVTLDARERAPARARRDMFLDAAGHVVPGRSTTSFLSVAAPGTVDGLLRLWTDHGSGAIDRETLLAPAVTRARAGFAVGPDLARRFNAHDALFRADPPAARIFLRADGRPWRAGDTLVQEDLACVLAEIAGHGREGFHGGWVADRIVETVDSGGGVLTRDDLTGYRPKYREPVRGSFHGHDIVSMGPPSAGGPLLIHLLHMLEQLPLREEGWNTAGTIHGIVECLHRAHADRAAVFGDPDFVSVPLARVLSPEYARERLAAVSRTRAATLEELAPGLEPGAETPPRPGSRSRFGETTHLSVMDGRGNCVALTTTLNAGFGCGRVVPGTGVLLNNEMDDFTLLRGASNQFGLVEAGEANFIAPRKRMLSNMTPALVLDRGAPRVVLGSPGGPRILSAVLQVILNVLVFDMPIARAVMAPRVHAQRVPHVLYAEKGALARNVARDLGARGHLVEDFPDGWIGRVNAIAAEGGSLVPGPDVSRGDNAAAAV